MQFIVHLTVSPTGKGSSDSDGVSLEGIECGVNVRRCGGIAAFAGPRTAALVTRKSTVRGTSSMADQVSCHLQINVTISYLIHATVDISLLFMPRRYYASHATVTQTMSLLCKKCHCYLRHVTFTQGIPLLLKPYVTVTYLVCLVYF